MRARLEVRTRLLEPRVDLPLVHLGAEGRARSGQALVEPVDELRHALELVGDDADPVLAEVLRLDAQRVRDPLDDVVRGHRAVPVDDVVQVARGEIRPVGEPAVRGTGLDHQALDRRPEGVVAVSPTLRHQSCPAHFSMSWLGTRSSRAPSRVRTSTAPSSNVFFPTITRSGQPTRSASANFSPGRSSRSSRRTSNPASPSASATFSASASTSSEPPVSARTWTSYGAIDLGHRIPFSSWFCSTAAAIARAGPTP